MTPWPKFASSAELADAITVVLAGYSFVFPNEKVLHDGIAKALDQNGVPYQRERAVAGGRLDFLVDGGVAIEVKVDGSLPAALTQIDGYLANDEVVGAVIASTTLWARTAMRTAMLRNKPVRIVRLERGAF